MARARYHVVYTRVWTSPDVRALGPDARDAWLYLLTCPHRTTEGLFRLPGPVAAYDLQWTPQRTALAFSELEQAGFIALDPGADLVWLVNAVAWNMPKGAKRIKGAVNALAEVPSSPLQAHYLDRCRSVCPELADAIRSELAWPDTPSIPLRYPIEGPSITQAQPHSQPQAPPPPVPSDHPGPDPAADTALVVLADQTIQAAMQDPTVLADAAQRQAVAEVLAAGHLPSAVLAAGADAAAGHRPAALLRAILKRLASEAPAAAPAPPATAEPCPNPECSNGWVGGHGPDGRPADPERCPSCTGVRA